MTLYQGKQNRQSTNFEPTKGRSTRVLSLEPLESRELLTNFYTGPSSSRTIRANAAYYNFSISGPGLETIKPAGKGAVAITLYGTNSTSTLNLSVLSQHPRSKGLPLSIASINVVTGQIGSIQAGGAGVLTGAINPLGSAGLLQFAGLGPDAKIVVNGGLGSLGVSGDVNLGPNGLVQVAGDVSQGINVSGGLNSNGGQILLGHNVLGPIVANSINLSKGAQISVGHNLAGATINNSVTLDSSSHIDVGNDMTGPLQIGGGLTLTNGARIGVGRDLTSGLTINGNLNISGNGRLSIGRNLSNVNINGNVTVDPSGGEIIVGGNLNGINVGGTFQGQGSSTGVDLNVGLDLNSLTVNGGAPGVGGLYKANIAVGKSIVGINIVHGIFESLLTAGVLIDGGATNPSSFGPDGTDAIYNSQLIAGATINHIIVNGDVRSTFATNPSSTGYPTRIIAGMNRAGQVSTGGLIDNFQILGTMYDSVLAASVAPSGGNGTLPTFAYGAGPPTPSSNTALGTYDAPAGVIVGGTVGNPVKYANYSEVSYYNETFTGVTYDTKQSPTINDFILPGAINPSFASPPVVLSASATPTTALALPTKSTILGGVVSTVHDQSSDFAGIFAADTRGVFLGAIPNSSS